MMTDLIPFDFNGQSVRALVDEQGEPQFVASDVMGILGLGNTTEVLRGLDEDEFSTTEVVDSLGRKQQSYIVSEAGLYSLILRSRKPEAKPFRRWVTHEVLPSIRKYGAYATPQTIEQLIADPQFGIRLLTELADEQTKRKVAEAHAAELESPARAWQNLADAKGDYSVSDAAKILARDPSIHIGQNRLHVWMADNGWTFRRKDGRPQAMQTKIDVGLLSERVSREYWSEKEQCFRIPAPTIRVTPKGLERLYRELGGMTPLPMGEAA